MLINLLISPECAEQIVCQALVGTTWHTEFCWACAVKTQNKPFGNSCMEHLLICLSSPSVNALWNLRWALWLSQKSAVDSTMS